MGEVPLLKQLHQRYEAEGLGLIGVSVDQSAEALDRMVADKAISWPQLWEGNGFEGTVPKAYAMKGTPLLYLVDRGGRLAGRFDSVEGVERELPEVVAAPASAPRTRRDQWQRPWVVMDRLGIRPGTAVADIGAGEGYFSLRLAARVGAEGKVYAVDIDEKALATLRQSAQAQGLTPIHTVLGTANDPRVPAATADVALVVDAYHEFTDPASMLRGIRAALRPGGRLGILEASDALGRPRRDYEERHRLPPEVLVEEAARQGFRLETFEPELVKRPGDTPQYLIVFRNAE